INRILRGTQGHDLRLCQHPNQEICVSAPTESRCKRGIAPPSPKPRKSPGPAIHFPSPKPLGRNHTAY
ncbi:MAG: hypothetical protein IJS19_08900, partial [Muribaculaceae bacterium]|nr:hypothetical protein [Muribaculaceae bacterium]